MEQFKENQKRIYWGVLVGIQLLPFIYKPNISIQLLVNSVCCVGLGSLYAISIKKGKRVKTSDDDESLSMSDAAKFPFMASAALMVLYVLFKNIDKDILNMLFKANFAIMGMSAIGAFFEDSIAETFPNLPNKEVFKKKLVLIAGKEGEKDSATEINFDITTHNLITYTLGAVIGISYVCTNHWFFNNLLGITFTIGGIMLLRVSKFAVVFLLLWALFIYDIFWVFGSDVMVTVAKNFDVPIKLLFPLSSGKNSLLGLGDMVIPGLLTALALKFDVDNGIAKYTPGKDNTLPEIETPTFNFVMIGYAAGMIATFVGMSLMEKAQPALLYLVPTCCFGLILSLILEKQLFKALSYQSDPTDEEKKEKV